MKKVNNILYLTFAEMVACGVSESAMKKAKQRASASWNFIDDPTDKRKVLVQYEALTAQYKALVIAKYGNPDEHVENPAPSLLTYDHAADAFYHGYRTLDGLLLKNDIATECINAAKWMNLAAKLAIKCPSIDAATRKTLTADKWVMFAQAVKASGVKLPANYSNLMAKLREYNTAGAYNYACLVDGRAANQNASKKLSDAHVSLLMRLIADHRNPDDAMVSKLFNIALAELGETTTISDSTVRRYRIKNYNLISGVRRGEKEFTQATLAQVKRTRPTTAGMMVSMDGWTVELLFQNTHYKSGKKQVDFHNRLDLMAVVDPYNDYILGYYIGKESADSIKAAVKNAVDNIYRLTGKYYLLNQVQNDHFAHKILAPWLTNVCQYYTPAQVGNSKAKPVEAFFNRLNNQYFRMQPNWSGHNVTSSKDNQPNMDWIMKHKHYLPTIEEGYHQIQSIIEDHRAEREAEWLASFASLVESGRMIEITREQYLLKFGTTKVERGTDKPETNRLTPQGLGITIGGDKYHYNILDEQFKSLTWIDWTTIYDPDNMDSILAVNEERGYRYLLPATYRPSMAIMDRKEGDGQYLADVKRLKQKQSDSAASFINEAYETADLLLPNPKDPRLKMIITTGGQHKTTMQKLKKVAERPVLEPHPSLSNGEGNANPDADIDYDELALNNL